MIVIPPQKNVMNKWALVPEADELKAITHALVNEHESVVRGGGNQYGGLSIEKLQKLIAQLKQFANYNKGS